MGEPLARRSRPGTEGESSALRVRGPTEVQGILDRLPASGPRVAAAGVGLLLFGTAVAALGWPWGGILGHLLCTSSLTAGGGLTFLGLLKWRLAQVPPMRVTDPVDVERGRRIRDCLARRERPMLFEALQAELGWTEEALVSGLMHLKERGEVSEDLDLDTGEWVYALMPGDPWTRPRPSLMLEERRSESMSEGSR